MSEITVPYENATSGEKARAEVNALLRRFGCDNIGWMDRHERRTVILTFTHQGRQMTLEASAAGWAAMYLRARPWNTSRRLDKLAYTAKAHAQGIIAINSILRDWVKGQVTAIECGLLKFEDAFLPVALLPDGRRVLDVVQATGLLSPPREETSP